MLAKNTKPCWITPQIRCKDTKRTIQLLREGTSRPLYSRHDGKDWATKYGSCHCAVARRTVAHVISLQASVCSLLRVVK